MKKNIKYAIAVTVAVVALVVLTKSIVSTLLTVAVVGAVAAGSYWAYNKYKEFKGKEYLSSVVKRSSSASKVSANSPSKVELTQEMQEERQFMFTNNKHKE